MKEQVKEILINNRYLIDFSYPDGVVYDTEQGQDIPSWVFEFKENLTKDN